MKNCGVKTGFFWKTNFLKACMKMDEERDVNFMSGSPKVAMYAMREDYPNQTHSMYC